MYYLQIYKRMFFLYYPLVKLKITKKYPNESFLAIFFINNDKVHHSIGELDRFGSSISPTSIPHPLTVVPATDLSSVGHLSAIFSKIRQVV